MIKLRKILGRLLKEAEISPSGEMVGKMSSDYEMDTLKDQINNKLENDYYNHSIGEFKLQYGVYSMYWKTEHPISIAGHDSNWIVTVDLFKDDMFEMDIVLHQVKEDGWDQVKHKEIPISPEILNANLDDVIEFYFYELRKFIESLPYN
jgi:hypothetical protein